MTLNKVWLVGRLARDPESKEIKQFLVCKLTVVVETSLKSRDEEKKEVCYMDCTVWNKEAELCQKYLKKGSYICIEGRLKQDKWIDKDSGKERTKHVLVAENVTFLEKLKLNEPREESPQEYTPRQVSAHSQPKLPSQPPYKQSVTKSPEMEESFDDDLPF